MAFELAKTPDDDRRETAQKPAVANCPVCDGEMEVVYARNNQQVIVCKDCHSGLTIPRDAWDIVRIKREAKWMPKP
jgi:ssDNA-binding Zn-finger/Zn-ribbon topoisomerase 1